MSLATQKPERGRLSQAANLGIDVGGTSIKAAVVGQDGLLLWQRLEVPTPQPATPETVGRTLQRLVSPIDTDGRVGIALPAPIVNSTVLGHPGGNLTGTKLDTRRRQQRDDLRQCLRHPIVLPEDPRRH